MVAASAAAGLSALAFADSGNSSGSAPVSTKPLPGLKYAYPGDQKPIGAQAPDPTKHAFAGPEAPAQTPLTLDALKQQAAAQGETIKVVKQSDGTFSVAVGIPAPAGAPVVAPPSGHYGTLVSPVRTAP